VDGRHRQHKAREILALGLSELKVVACRFFDECVAEGTLTPEEGDAGKTQAAG
jgi:hypothetical protein